MAQNLQDDVWRQISNAIDEIYSSPVESLTPARYMELHKYVFCSFINCFSSFVISSFVYGYMTDLSPATRYDGIQLATDFYRRLQTYLREKVNNAYHVSFVID
jgi:hypothetical protein